MIGNYINELVRYGINKGLIDEADVIYTANKLIELFGCSAYSYDEEYAKAEPREVSLILADMIKYACENGLIEDDSVTITDLFDTKVMGLITPPPSYVIKKFADLYEKSPKAATDFFYDFSRDNNYIRTERVKKDEKWVVDTEYGPIDITINLSKPEKDPRDIARAGAAKKSGYPSCLLCVENEGYAGHLSHPARQNHRIIPIELMGEEYGLQYSPYVYYNEHCIILNKKHIPMKINKDTFVKLLDFVNIFPHYMAGSNADLPIVGGSILSHDHFQGGGYVFAMAKAPIDRKFELKNYPNVSAGTVKWPMSVIRLNGKNIEEIASAAEHILKQWREYTDEVAFIFSHTGETPHNTITPIARMNGDLYELDLVLRNNITTDECPWGVYHPIEKYHHIKKENIGLIEVMGLAVLPARLKKEIEILKDAMLSGKDIRAIEEIEKHADWVDEFKVNYPEINAENIDGILKKEIGIVFTKVLECAGVYKCTEEGKAAFKKFTDIL
ncbi:MAG: UDP-glucose--hexose-1-phosphate uridylyltransferase [Lachnospiraceae bacterium]|nr:UDP-glucose--hexose-1-phosphate uridylyltransferase [Lachnospiraceae bacterium]